MVEGNLDEIFDRLEAAELREPSNVLHQSSIGITCFFWVDDRMLDGEIRDVLNYALVSKQLPNGGVWYWVPIPRCLDDALWAKEIVVNNEIEAARQIYTGEAVAEYAHLLLLIVCENAEMRMENHEILGVWEKSPQQRELAALLAKKNREWARSFADQIGKDARNYFSDLLEMGGARDFLTFGNLQQMHDVLKRLWKEASKIATQARRSNLRRNGWRDEVRLFFARQGVYGINDDLITRLDDPGAWPDDLTSTLEKHGAEGKPYDIALEHAARMVGSPSYENYSLTLRQLKEKLKNG